jgi:hypothetical protein
VGRGSWPSAASATGSTPRRLERLRDRDCRPALGIVGLVGAADSATARISPGKRIEVEPCLGAGVTHRVEATAAFGARDGRATTVANCDGEADLGLSGVDHLGSRLSDQSGGTGGELGRRYSPPLYRDSRWRRPARSASGRDRPGCDPVAGFRAHRPPSASFVWGRPSTINHPERTSRRLSEAAARTTIAAPSRLWGSHHVSAAASAHRWTVPFRSPAIRSRVADCRRSRAAARLVRPGCDRRP